MKSAIAVVLVAGGGVSEQQRRQEGRHGVIELLKQRGYEIARVDK